MSASILHLLQHLIRPVAPAVWLRHRVEGDPASGDFGIDMRCRLHREEHLQWIEDRLAQAMWSSVTEHEAKSGLWSDEPPLIEPTRTINQKMLPNGKAPEAMALQAAVTYNVLCASRATQDPTLCLCPRCGGEAETLLHRFWACPNNRDCVHPDIVSTQHLISDAIARAGSTAAIPDAVRSGRDDPAGKRS